MGVVSHWACYCLLSLCKAGNLAYWKINQLHVSPFSFHKNSQFGSGSRFYCSPFKFLAVPFISIRHCACKFLVTNMNSQSCRLHFFQCIMLTQKCSFVSKFLLSVVLSLKLFTLENPSITRLLSQIDDPFLPSGALHGAPIFHLQTGMMLTAWISQPTYISL